MLCRRILIVGGSTRAAADSVRRAGWQPICADLFADYDLRETAEVVPVRRYPESLAEDLQHIQADGWFYCGALENRPEILDRILENGAQYGPLLGADPAAVRSVRDPQWLTEVMLDSSMPTLEINDGRKPPQPDGTWMQKPLASAGGRCVRVWDELASVSSYDEPHYFQRRVQGMGLSALLRVDSGDIECLGICQELDARTSSRAPSKFAYCGSYGPIQPLSLTASRSKEATYVDDAFTPVARTSEWLASDSPLRRSSGVLEQVTRIAKAIVDRAPGLKGLIGLDFQWKDGIVWLLEVNPRYTASVEVLELAQGRAFLNSDCQCESGPANASSQRRSNHTIVMKQILYASNSFSAPDLSPYLPSSDPWKLPFMADIPIPGSIVEAGWPICTVLAGGEEKEEVAACLAQRVSIVRAALDRME